MKKLLFLTVFFPSLSWGVCSSFTYTISERPVGYSGVRYYVCDTDIDKPSSGLTMGEKAFIKDSGVVYFATSTTGWALQVGLSTEVTNVRNLKWSDTSFLSTTSIANYSLLSNSLSISSTSSSYLGVSSAAAMPTYFSASLSTGVTGNLSVNNLNSGIGATSLTFWKGDGSWGVPLGGFLDGLTLSSAALSYQGISSTPWTSTMLPLSSSSTFQDKASGATTYLTIGSSSTFNQALTQLSSFTAFSSSMPVSYLGISSNTFLKINISTNIGTTFGASTITVSNVIFSSYTTLLATQPVVISTFKNAYTWGQAPIAFATASLPSFITGFNAGMPGANFTLFNVSTQPIFIVNGSTFSTQPARISLSSVTTTGTVASSVYLSSGDCMSFIYDQFRLLWRQRK